MASIGVPGIVLVLVAFGGIDPGSVLIAQLFGSANFGLMMMMGGGL